MGNLEFTGFNQPDDGQTRVVEIGEYGTQNIHARGWNMVGICRATSDGTERLFGVYRRTKDESLRVALEERKKAEEDAAKARTAQADAERQLRDAHKRIAALEEENEEWKSK